MEDCTFVVVANYENMTLHAADWGIKQNENSIF